MIGRIPDPRTLRRRTRVLAAVLLSGALVTTGILFAFSVHAVQEQSMWPGLEGGRDRVLAYRLAEPGADDRFSVWIYEDPQEAMRDGPRLRIKRVLGFGGETLDFRGGDLFIGSDRGSLQRMPRPASVVDAMMVPVYPGSGGMDAQRFAVRRGRLTGQGGVLGIEADDPGGFEAVLKGAAAGSTEVLLDDHLDALGALVPGTHPVPDIRIEATIRELQPGGTLALRHELQEEERVLEIADGGWAVSVRDPGAGRRLLASGPLPALPFRVRMETLDGLFRVGLVGPDGDLPAAWFEGPRDTMRCGGYSRVAILLDRGRATLEDLDVSRDVYWYWPPPLAGAHHVWPGHIWLAGDNPPVSRDSRDEGPVPLPWLVGQAVRVLGPGVLGVP